MNMKTLSRDLPAGLVVFLVALPLCLGIALASGAPLMSGIISGIIGGIVIGAISGSHTSVSGPAAGLAAVVLGAIQQLGSFEIFLFAVMLAGLIQLLLGMMKMGYIADFFPSNVIKGLLAAIGIVLILKQIPHAIGYDADYEGDFGFFDAVGENTFSSLLHAVEFITPGAVLIAILSEFDILEKNTTSSFGISTSLIVRRLTWNRSFLDIQNMDSRFGNSRKSYGKHSGNGCFKFAHNCCTAQSFLSFQKRYLDNCLYSCHCGFIGNIVEYRSS